MPVLSGVDICARIRESRDRPYCYNVLVTGRRETTDIVQVCVHGSQHPRQPDQFASGSSDLIDIWRFVQALPDDTGSSGRARSPFEALFLA